MVTKPTIWPQGRFGVPQITPYTYRDGHGLLELIKAVRDHVVDELHPNLQTAIDQLVADVETEYGKALDRYVDGVQEFQRIHDAFMFDVEANMIALNDASMSKLLLETESRTGATIRSLMTDIAHVVYIEDHGYLPDDPTTHDAALKRAIDDAATSLRPLKLPRNAVLSLTQQVVIPSNLTVLGSNATLQWDNRPAQWAVVGEDVHTVTIQDIHIKVNGEEYPDQRGIGFIRCQNLTLMNVSADAQHPVTGLQSIYATGISVRETTNAHLENVHVSNWAHAIYLGQSQNITVVNPIVSIYRYGIQFIDVKNVEVNGGHFHTNDGSYVDNHGGLGTLIESKSHDATDGIIIRNLRVQDCASHGHRIGGRHRVRNVTYDHCEVSNTQRGGFKTMGGMPEDRNWHENIKYLNCRVYDCGQTVDNSDGFQIELTNHVVVDNPIVGTRTKPYSTGYGISIKGSHDVVVNNPEVSGSRYAALALLPQRGDISDVTINGGHLYVNQGDAIRFDGHNIGFRRNKILGHPTIEIVGEGRHAIVARIGTGDNGIVSGRPILTAYIPYSGISVVDPYAVTSLLTVNLIGPFNPAVDPAQFNNGSQWLDQTSTRSGLYVKLHSAWHRMGE